MYFACVLSRRAPLVTYKISCEGSRISSAIYVGIGGTYHIAVGIGPILKVIAASRCGFEAYRLGVCHAECVAALNGHRALLVVAVYAHGTRRGDVVFKQNAEVGRCAIVQCQTGSHLRGRHVEGCAKVCTHIAVKATRAGIGRADSNEIFAE